MIINESPSNTQDKDIVVNAANSSNFSMFSNALRAAGLDKTYKEAGPFTIFAPTDAAFRKLPEAQLHALLKDKEKLTNVLNFHAMNGAILAADIKHHDLPSIQGETLKMEPVGLTFTVNGAKASRHEIEASNGVIHGIDTVMMPGA